MKGQRLNASIVVQSLLKTPDEFAAIPVRVNPDGSVVRIGDVGRTELEPSRTIPMPITTVNPPPLWPSGRSQARMPWIRPMQSKQK